jgi:uncharacterized membrane protein
MEYLIFILLVAVLILILNHNDRALKNFDSADQKIIKLEQKLNQVIQELSKLKPSAESSLDKKSTVEPESPKDSVSVSSKEDVSRAPIEKPLLFKQVTFPAVPERTDTPKVEQLTSKPVVKQKKVAGPTFLERNPDLEKFIGENLINKIGIAILVLGIGFFVKFAIDQNWINEIGRVAIGIACGGVLIGLAHKLRKSFNAFSSVLVGGGLAVFYFTITIAFQDYHIFSQPVAFVLMVLITAFAVLLSIAYNRQELAILSIVGGFISPMLLSTGAGNYVVLFSYVLLLNVGMIVLAYFKRWHLVNLVCYVFTIILYGAWLQTKVLDQDTISPPYLGAFIFATVFYVVFFVMNIINNIKENKAFIAAEIMILVSNNFLFYSSGMLILKNIEGALYQGAFTALLAIFNFIFAYTLYKSKKADLTLIYLLIGLVLTFVSLAAPVQLKGNYITLFWAVEAVLLLWLSQKSGISLIKWSSVLVMVLMLISLVMDWFKVYEVNDDQVSIVLNKAFVTGFVCLLSMICMIRLLKNEIGNFIAEITVNQYRLVAYVILLTLAYLVFLLELNFQLNSRVEDPSIRMVYLFLYNFTVALAYMLFTFKKSAHFLLLSSLALTGLGCIVYWWYYDDMVMRLRDEYLISSRVVGVHYYIHYLVSAVLLAMLWMSGRSLRKFYPIDSKVFKAFIWISAGIFLILLSAALQNILVSVFYTGGDFDQIIVIEEHIFQIAYPILWGLCSFVAMYIGMSKKIKTYRILSLVVFAITLLKLFVFDVSSMSEGGKIGAFISLGVLLLIISFMYQKLKKIITEDDKVKN